jgi:hypothetical protein
MECRTKVVSMNVLSKVGKGTTLSVGTFAGGVLALPKNIVPKVITKGLSYKDLAQNSGARAVILFRGKIKATLAFDKVARAEALCAESYMIRDAAMGRAPGADLLSRCVS